MPELSEFVNFVEYLAQAILPSRGLRLYECNGQMVFAAYEITGEIQWWKIYIGPESLPANSTTGWYMIPFDRNTSLLRLNTEIEHTIERMLGLDRYRPAQYYDRAENERFNQRGILSAKMSPPKKYPHRRIKP